MRDYNFFIIYSKDYQKKFDRNSPYLKALVVVLLFILIATGMTARNSIVSSRNDMKAMEFETLVGSPGYIEAMGLQKAHEVMITYDEKASVALDKLENAKVLGSKLLVDVTGKIPVNISVSSLNIGIDNMSISCTAPDRKSVAEFQLRLKELPFVGEVHSEDVRNKTEGAGVETTIVCTMIRKEAAE